MTFGHGRHQAKLSDAGRRLHLFFYYIPLYCHDGTGRFPGNPESWQPRLISYSLFCGLGVGLCNGAIASTLLEGMNEKMRATSDGALRELLRLDHPSIVARGSLWKRTVDWLDADMTLMSPETSGPLADNELVEQRAPIVGALCGLRLAVEQPAYAQVLFDDAAPEHDACDSKTFRHRVVFMIGESLRV